MPLEISPKAFTTINVSILSIGEFTSAMVYQTTHLSLGSNISVPSAGISVNSRTNPHHLVDQQGEKGRRLSTRNYLSP
jgi:hypothetical protein